METRTGTRRELGIEFGDRITLVTHLGPITGTVTRAGNSWTIADRDRPGHLPPYGHASKVTVVIR